MLAMLRTKNPDLTIYSVSNPTFLSFGKVLEGYDFSGFINTLGSKFLPHDGNTYTGCDSDLMALPVVHQLKRNFYADMPIEAGYCNGQGTKLNALEYHRGSEVDIAGTDLVLFLDHLSSIVDNKINSSSVTAFFVPAGTAVQIYETTLHFAPCRINKNGFRCGIILPEHTNEAFSERIEPVSKEDRLLWMRNKWLIAHKDSIPASKGAYIGIAGKNLEIFS